MNRRDVLMGLAGAGGTSGLPGSGVIEGESTWSESAMVLCFDDALRNGLSFRVSRYPDVGRTWVWCHLLFDGVVYAFTEQRLLCEPRHITAELDSASYEAPSMDARISRLGSSADLKALSFSFKVHGHRGGRGIDGPGPTLITAEGVFHPGPLRAGSRPGRFERGGHLEATIGIASQRKSLSGPAKAHEQTQTKPRFTTPFTYAMLWGRDASVIGLSASDTTYGDYQTQNTDLPFKSFQISKPGRERNFSMAFDSGKRVTGTSQQVASFDVPVFGRQWHGHIVRAEVEGRWLRGMINDWRPNDRIFVS